MHIILPLYTYHVLLAHTSYLDDGRSTTGYVFTLGGGLICWKSMVQSLVALSTTKSKYMAVVEAAKEVL